VKRARSFAIAAALCLSACQTLPRDAVVSSASGAIALAIKHCAIDANDVNEQSSANWTAKLSGGVWNVAYVAPPQLVPGTIAIGKISTQITARDGSASNCTAEMLVGGP
jgi:hypothetical protein